MCYHWGADRSKPHQSRQGILETYEWDHHYDDDSHRCHCLSETRFDCRLIHDWPWSCIARQQKLLSNRTYFHSRYDLRFDLRSYQSSWYAKDCFPLRYYLILSCDDTRGIFPSFPAGARPKWTIYWIPRWRLISSLFLRANRDKDRLVRRSKCSLKTNSLQHKITFDRIAEFKMSFETLQARERLRHHLVWEIH